MFTGIVDHCGQVVSLNKDKQNWHLGITSHFTDLVLGESIAIDGACLTVTASHTTTFYVDISVETVKLTNIDHYQQGTQVNLERSLRLTDRLGGHFVTGHIDSQCYVAAIKHYDNFLAIVFEGIQSYHWPYLVKKGSIAINGVSLTLNEVDENSFQVMLIPHTLEHTNLAQLQVGHTVNIEYDYLAKLVSNQLIGNKYEK